ncbi:MAG: hypothetical protein M1817_003364 [Caeruleum heppii]|nr:MAG: hypothetical protein M1817_003364 [Caeruleum heppii]
MPPKKILNGTASKRKASVSPKISSKKPAVEKNGVPAFRAEAEAEQYGVVQRKYYPPEMTNARALQYKNGELRRPLEELDRAQAETEGQRRKVKIKDAVVHWYKCDLRTRDNKALHLAAQKAKEGKVPLICIYIVSPQDFQAHLTAPVRVDFILRTLEVLKKDLAKLKIPLYVETVEKRRNVPGRILELMEEWGASHLFANIEYEVDELRRESMMTRQCLERGIDLTVVPDTCVVAPGELSSQQGNQYAVYSPWFRAWVAYLHTHPHQLNLYDAPGENPDSATTRFKHLFDAPIPDAPANKQLTDEEKKRFRSMWPPGEQEAHERLDKFLAEKVGKYKDTRNIPSANSTAVLSVHFASGTLSARTAIRTARDNNSTKKLDGGNLGIMGWISEVAWRDFYKHVLAHWPYVWYVIPLTRLCRKARGIHGSREDSMHKPFKPEYTNIEWEYDDDKFQAWCDGRTGYPIVDAGMRQLNYTGYMHNRCRMIVASFLAKDLLIDWRRGERYFMEHLIDGDFASNNGGWGFSASTGVDPQPYFRIFNPLLQSEKFDPDGEYIRKWIPELEGVTGKAVHDPYGRGSGKVVEKRGYPKYIVEHKMARERALARYKEGLGRETA